MKDEKILVVTGLINDEIEGIRRNNGLVDMPDWILDEIEQDNLIEAISTLLIDLNTMGPGFMLKESDFLKSVNYGGNQITDEQASVAEKALLKHGILISLDEIIKKQHPDWPEKEIKKEVARLFNEK